MQENYEYLLASTIDNAKQSGRHDELIFINEWSERCYLETDRWFGHGFLQDTLNAKNGLCRFSTFPEISPPHKIDEVSHRKFWKDMGSLFSYHAGLILENLTLTVNQRP